MSLIRFFPTNTIEDRRLLMNVIQPNVEFFWTNFVDFTNWFENYNSNKA